MIGWETFRARTIGVVARQRLGSDQHVSHFMFRDVIPFYSQERALSPFDLRGNPLSDREYKESQAFHETHTNQSNRLRVEILDQSTFHRMVNPEECEYLIDGRWVSFDELMA